MKENEVALSFYKSFVREKIKLPSVDGGTYELYIIEMPDEEGEEQEIRRTFTIPVPYLHTDREHSYIKYTYLKKDKLYRVMRASYDSEQRVTRCLENTQMSGKQIAAVFERYRKRKRKEFEQSFEAQEEDKDE